MFRRRNYELLGTFAVTSDKIRVSDPCYDANVWCSGVLENMISGNYNAYVAKNDEGDWGIRVAMLLIVHENFDTEEARKTADKVYSTRDRIVSSNDWVNSNIEVGVDSGQAGFFDAENYQVPASLDTDLHKMFIEATKCEEAGKTEKAAELRTAIDKALDSYSTEYGDVWYSRCCALTLSEVKAGTIPFGAVSESGFGDGGYCCFVRRDADGEGYEACILFI